MGIATDKSQILPYVSVNRPSWTKFNIIRENIVKASGNT